MVRAFGTTAPSMAMLGGIRSLKGFGELRSGYFRDSLKAFKGF